MQTQRQYQCHFAVRKGLDKKAVCTIIKKFQIDRTVHNVNKPRSGRTRGARTSENTG